MTNRKDALPILSAITTSVIFGLSFLFSKQAMDAADPLSLLAFRFLIAFLVMSILILFRVVKINYKNKSIKELFLISLIQPVLYFICESYGIKYSSTSEAGMMIALIPIVVSLLSVYFLNERPTLCQWLFIVLSVTGVIYILFMDNSSSSSGSLLGILFLTGAVLVGSLFNILSRKFSIKYTPFELTYFMMTTGAISFNIISLISHIYHRNLISYFKPLHSTQFIGSIIYLGVLSSIVAFFMLNFTLSKIEASKSTVFSNLTTIVSIAAGVLILKEKFHYYHLIGSILIILGVWGTNYFGYKKSIEADKAQAKI
jgi:drug/metabolite transporter (DMT)-like permease